MTAIALMALVTGSCATSSTVTSDAGPDPVKCQVSLATPPSLDAGGGTAKFSVTTQPECAWTASTSATWISALSPASGQGTQDVEFRAAPNPTSTARQGEIAVNESRLQISQRGACRYDVNPASQSVGAGGGAGAANVSTSSECTWSASTDVSWISLRAPLTGNGNGTVSFTVASNPGAERTGSVLIGGQRSVVTQSSPAVPPPPSQCTYTIAPTSQSIGAAGGVGTAVTVSTQSGCRWTAASNASWISVTSGASGTGNGSVAFAVLANAGNARTGTLAIAGQTFTVTQAAGVAPCTYSISPGSQKAGKNGDTKSVRVTTAAGCAWTAVSNVSWITITSAASGTGNGTVTFVVSMNTGAAREGTLTIAGQTATVQQDGDKGKNLIP